MSFDENAQSMVGILDASIMTDEDSSNKTVQSDERHSGEGTTSHRPNVDVVQGQRLSLSSASMSPVEATTYRDEAAMLIQGHVDLQTPSSVVNLSEASTSLSSQESPLNKTVDGDSDSDDSEETKKWIEYLKKLEPKKRRWILEAIKKKNEDEEEEEEEVSKKVSKMCI